MATILWGIVIVLLSVLLAVAGQALVQRLVPLRLRESSTVAIGLTYAALHVMYGVTLAFSLFLVWEAFSTPQRTTVSEAGNLERIYRLAEHLPEPQRDRMQELVESYGRVVVEEEWPLIGRGRESQGSPQAETIAEELLGSIEDFEPGTSREEALHSQGLTLIDALQDDREARLLESNQGIPDILWSWW